MQFLKVASYVCKNKVYFSDGHGCRSEVINIKSTLFSEEEEGDRSNLFDWLKLID